jgi:hypothetical protein
MNMNMDIPKYIIFFIGMVVLSHLYNKLLKSDDQITSDYYYKMVDQYLITNQNLGNNNKPFLWIHLHNNNAVIPEINSRSWLNFLSRNSNNFNQPYQYLTIKSIIEKCSDDFNICLIDDNSFKKILPEWSVDLDSVASPIKNHLRLLALSNLLYIYGGVLLPSSFICFKSLKSLHDENIDDKKMFVGEFANKTCGDPNYVDFIATPHLMGCNKNNDKMKEFIEYLEVLNSTDFVAEMDFVGKPNQWLQNNCLKGDISLIDGSLLGTKNNDGKRIFVEELISSTFINLDDNAVGLYVPWDELINRTALEWFVRLSSKQVLESNTFIGKQLLNNTPD